MTPKLHLVRTPPAAKAGAPPSEPADAPATMEAALGQPEAALGQPEAAPATTEAAPTPAPTLTPKQRALVDSAMPMMFRIVKLAVGRAADSRVTERGLLGIATIALHEAGFKFRAGESAKFLHYARIRVRGEVRTAIAAITHRTRLRHRVEDRMEEASDDFSETQILPIKMLTDSVEDLAEALRQGAADALDAGYVASLYEGQQASPEEEMSELEGRRATTAALVKAIRTLYPHERETLLLIYVQRVKQEDAAKTLGIQRRALNKRLTTALRKLREEMIGPGRKVGRGTPP